MSRLTTFRLPETLVHRLWARAQQDGPRKFNATAIRMLELGLAEDARLRKEKQEQEFTPKELRDA